MDRIVRQMTEEDPRERGVITGLEEAPKSKRTIVSERIEISHGENPQEQPS